MDRVAIFVDAGYLFAQGSVALIGEKKPRGHLELHAEKAIAALERFARDLVGLPILRTYWYDGTSTGPTPQHLTLAHLAGVKLRLGFVNSAGMQKGVDSLIVTDMITLARNQAIAEAILLSGDEDLRVGVQQAQEFGVRVHLLGIQPSRGSQSLFLLQEADSTHEWDLQNLAPFLSCRAPSHESPIPMVPSHDHADQIIEISESVARSVSDDDLEALVLSIQHTGQIPKELDVQLLTTGRTRLGTSLDSEQKRLARVTFRRACEVRLGRPQ